MGAEARTGADGLLRYFCTRCKREVSDPADAVCSRCAFHAENCREITLRARQDPARVVGSFRVCCCPEVPGAR